MDIEDQKQIDQTLALCERAEWLYCVQTYLMMLHVDDHKYGPELTATQQNARAKANLRVMGEAGRVPSSVLKPDTMADQAISFVDFHLAGKPRPEWLPT